MKSIFIDIMREKVISQHCLRIQNCQKTSCNSFRICHLSLRHEGVFGKKNQGSMLL